MTKVFQSFSLVLCLMASFSGFSAIGGDLTDEKNHRFRNQLRAAEKNPTVCMALGNDRTMKEAAIDHMNRLLAVIQERSQGVDPAALLEGLQTRLMGEKAVLSNLSAALQPFRPGHDVPYSVKTNKMLLAVEDLLEKYANPNNLQSLAEGRHLFDMSLSEQSCPAILGAGFWGTTQGTRYELFLLAVAAQLRATQDQAHLSILGVLQEAGINIDETPIAHMAPLPQDVLEKVPGLEKSLFFASDYMGNGTNLPAFIQPHTGFLFGGHRNPELETRYPAGKEFGPEDCSSFVGKATNYPHVIATLYQWLFWASVQNPAQYQKVLSQINLEQRADIETQVGLLSQHFTAIPLEEIQPGDVFGYRVQKEGGPLGTGGHTGVYIGRSADGNPLFLGPNRGLPDTQVDGFGIEEKPLQPTFAQFAMRPVKQS